MTKTKKQLRAEAVERLKNSEYHTALDDICSMLGWGHEPHFEGATDALIDLLTDDANDDSAPEKVVSDPDGWSNVAYIAPDSRDKLEADVRKIAEAYNMDEQRHGTERFAHELYYSIIHLLNRQAAITERETTKRHELFCEKCEAESDKQIAELTAELEKATNNLNSANEDFENARVELTAERDELQEQLYIGWECECRLQAERDHYRSKFGKCLDYADAIHALMDDEGMA